MNGTGLKIPISKVAFTKKNIMDKKDTLRLALSLYTLCLLQSNLDYPDLDYPDFFSGPVFFMNINRL